ncbi:MAG: YraN family protein [Bacteroidota bacterium]
MSKHHETGREGERLARQHLQTLGYVVEATSYRHGRVELDLIARTADDCLVFVEVKTRRGLGFGHPSAAVTPAKEENIARAAGAYMEEIGHEWEVRFDIISVLLYKDGSHDLEHLEDAFFPGLF